MSKILVNYNYNKSKDKYTLLDSGVVFADLPVAVLESEQEIIEPLIVPIKGTMTVVEKEPYTTIHKKFKLALDNKGNVVESENGMEIWLPRKTDISKLAYINGQLVMKEETISEETEVEEKSKPKNKTGGKK
jgi:hypothetical protein